MREPTAPEPPTPWSLTLVAAGARPAVTSPSSLSGDRHRKPSHRPCVLRPAVTDVNFLLEQTLALVITGACKLRAVRLEE